MKNLILKRKRVFTLALIGTFLIGLSSCKKKDRTCICTFSDGSQNVVIYGNVTQEEAEDLCFGSLAAGIGGDCLVD